MQGQSGRWDRARGSLGSLDRLCARLAAVLEDPEHGVASLPPGPDRDAFERALRYLREQAPGGPRPLRF